MVYSGSCKNYYKDNCAVCVLYDSFGTCRKLWSFKSVSKRNIRCYVLRKYLLLLHEQFSKNVEGSPFIAEVRSVKKLSAKFLMAMVLARSVSNLIKYCRLGVVVVH
jgi:hypothetical protein